jgi:uncharacterized SAM-binding protein YcdF (DUF218 family)
MLSRFLSLALLIYLLGFLGFAILLPGPHGDEKTDAAVVFTGGKGRIVRGLETLSEGWTRQLLVSGVDKDVTPREFALEYKVSAKTMKCCVTLDYKSSDTISNAQQASLWLTDNEYHSVRLITSDWHMRRAGAEMEDAKPEGVLVIRDSVSSQPSFQILLLEYHKLLARSLSRLWQD